MTCVTVHGLPLGARSSFNMSGFFLRGYIPASGDGLLQAASHARTLRIPSQEFTLHLLALPLQIVESALRRATLSLC